MTESDNGSLELVMRAAAFAAKAHEKHRRKTGDVPYINHLIRVAHRAAEVGLPGEVVAAAFLHDTVEDTRVTFDDLHSRFPDRVVQLVKLLTQWWPDDAPVGVKEAQRPRYYAALLDDLDAIHLKLLDRADNLTDMARVVSKNRRWAESFLRRSESEIGPLYETAENDAVKQIYNEALAVLRNALKPGKK